VNARQIIEGEGTLGYDINPSSSNMNERPYLSPRVKENTEFRVIFKVDGWYGNMIITNENDDRHAARKAIYNVLRKANPKLDPNKVRAKMLELWGMLQAGRGWYKVSPEPIRASFRS